MDPTEEVMILASPYASKTCFLYIYIQLIPPIQTIALEMSP